MLVEGRKRTDFWCAVVFLVAVVVNFVLGLAMIVSSNGYVMTAYTKNGDACKDSFCYFDGTGCEFGEVSLMKFTRDNRAEVVGERCANPCVEEYFYDSYSSLCVKKSSIEYEELKACRANFGRSNGFLYF